LQFYFYLQLTTHVWHIPLPLSSLKQQAKNVRDGKENDMMTKLFPLLTFSIAYSLFPLLFHFFNGLTMLTLFPLLFQFSCFTQRGSKAKSKGFHFLTSSGTVIGGGMVVIGSLLSAIVLRWICYQLQLLALSGIASFCWLVASAFWLPAVCSYNYLIYF